jgi:molybdopterin/thiamine biosynthesis adenylyltransferase/rhodanese-related sulfurtransferase
VYHRHHSYFGFTLLVLTLITEERYKRHILLPEVGVAGQQKLSSAKVVCIGAGGLGSPVLLYLAAAGVGTLGILDDDVVDVSNLQRQIIYREQDIGDKKVHCAKRHLSSMNSSLLIHTYEQRLTQQNAMSLLSDYDIVIDCTDNFASHYLINDACFHLKKPLVAASIYQFEGQCSVFLAPDGPCYRCLYPLIPDNIPSCQEAGVLGVLPGLLGSIQATEVIKLILGIGQSLMGRLLTVNALTMQFHEFELKRNPECHHQSLFYVQESCYMQIEEVTVSELLELQKQKIDLLVLDVREPSEYEADHMNGKLIPLGQLSDRLDELDRDQLIIVHCKSGGRSSRAVAYLMGEGFKNVKNLKGGITAWREVIKNKIY